MPAPPVTGPFSITVTFSEPVTSFGARRPRRRERQRVGAAGGSNASYTATSTPPVSGRRDGGHRGRGGAGRHRQPERGGGAVLDRLGPDAGAGSAGDRRDRACAAVAGRRRSPADGELTLPGAGAANALPEGGTRPPLRESVAPNGMPSFPGSTASRFGWTMTAMRGSNPTATAGLPSCGGPLYRTAIILRFQVSIGTISPSWPPRPLASPS